jgi:hypothetical protein
VSDEGGLQFRHFCISDEAFSDFPVDFFPTLTYNRSQSVPDPKITHSMGKEFMNMKKSLKTAGLLALMLVLCLMLTGCDLRGMIANGAGGGVASEEVVEKKDPIVGIIQEINGRTITIQVFRKDDTAKPENTSSKTSSYLVMQDFPMDQYTPTQDSKTHTLKDSVPLFIPSGSSWKTAEMKDFAVGNLIVIYTDGAAGESMWRLKTKVK